MKPDFRELYEREKQVFHIINKIEQRGLAFDAAKAELEARKLQAKMNGCLARIYKVAGEHNVNSPKQVLAALLDLRISRKMLTYKGKLTTEADILVRTRGQLSKDSQAAKYINGLLEYRSYTKTVGTYLEPLARKARLNKGIVLCSINPTDARTGRMASRDPDLQNIPEIIHRKTGRPSPVRSCFICREGYNNYYFDYKQMEMALFGLYTGERVILDAYENKEDIHSEMASYIYGKDYTNEQRGLTKNINFGIIFGMGFRAMSLIYGMKERQAKEHIQYYNRKFPSIRKFQDDCEWTLRQQGYVEDWFGRRYHIPVGQAYKAVNALVQGGCAQIFKIALIQLDAFLNSKSCRIILPVHDEFQVESRIWKYMGTELSFIHRVIAHMTCIEQLEERGLKLQVDVSKTSTNWAEKKKIEL